MIVEGNHQEITRGKNQEADQSLSVEIIVFYPIAKRGHIKIYCRILKGEQKDETEANTNEENIVIASEGKILITVFFKTHVFIFYLG